MSYRPGEITRSSDLSTSATSVESEAPATCLAACRSKPPRNTDNCLKIIRSDSDRSPHEWSNTASRLR